MPPWGVRPLRSSFPAEICRVRPQISSSCYGLSTFVPSSGPCRPCTTLLPRSATTLTGLRLLLEQNDQDARYCRGTSQLTFCQTGLTRLAGSRVVRMTGVRKATICSLEYSTRIKACAGLPLRASGLAVPASVLWPESPAEVYAARCECRAANS